MIVDFMPVSLVDFPGNIATTVFIGSCNLRCCYCHNAKLLQANTPPGKEEELFHYLESRKKLINSVCITGGEPTLWPGLMNFILKLKSLDYNVKLDTNGTNLRVLKQLLAENLVDYIAMDIKTTPAKYADFGASKSDIENIKGCVELLKNSDINYEFRTTVIESQFSTADALETGQWLEGAMNYVLQGFKYSDQLLMPERCPQSNCQLGYLEHLQEVLRQYFRNIKIRY